MSLLSVENLWKTYPGFALKNVSFSVEAGSIMGFIGRNGAGKTTTLKAMLGLVHTDGGSVTLPHKEELGVVFGEADYYRSRHLSDIAAATKRFYVNWNEPRYRELLQRFSLDEHKRVKELSAGMRVKFALALALSHGAKLLILDEPTSGLDPVSRDELIGIFLDLAAEGTAILFSTHIISDLEKCADSITYIQKGEILASCDIESFANTYRLVTGGREELTDELRGKLIGCREHAFGFEALVKTEDAEGLAAKRPGLEEIMVHLEREA